MHLRGNVEEKSGVGSAEGCNSMKRADCKEVTFKQLRDDEGVSRVTLWDMSIPGRVTSRCQSPESEGSARGHWSWSRGVV